MRRYIALLVGIAACTESSPRASNDSTAVSRAVPVITSVRVNQATYGMSSKVKWIVSGDSSSILAMVDPRGVESDPLPNSFFYGSETKNFQARMDSVWDVAVSPDWNTIAFSRAYIVSAGGEDSIPPAMWVGVARRTGLDTATVRTASFASSGMSMSRGIAQAGTITVPADARATSAGDDAAPKMYPVAVGWRVRWTADGSLIALGNSPAVTSDEAESETWASLDPKTAAFHTSLPSNSSVTAPKWKTGPTLEMAAPVDLEGAPAINISPRGRKLTIESARGVISAREAGIVPDSSARTYTIGSGKALAATKGGRYILALAPRAKAVAGEIPVEVVVYVVGW